MELLLNFSQIVFVCEQLQARNNNNAGNFNLPKE